MEIAVHDASGAFRTVYTVSIGDSIYVIHAFQKKAKAGIATPKSEMDLIRQRLKLLRIEVKMPKRKAFEQEPSTGDVFADLGMANASEHVIKAGLVARIDRIIRKRKLTQAGAAELMGIDQPKVSAMLAGQFRGYSVERLMRFLVALGHDVEIVVKPKKRGTAELRVT
jgi:predicted XRE-type DNA-binding protein